MRPNPNYLFDPEEVKRVTAPLDSAYTLPPAAYADSNVFEIEISNIFLKAWMCVGRSEQVAQRGDYFSVDLPGMPLIICRDNQGELRALSRVCLHRAMPLVEGRGQARRFVCPYHHWTYELDGRLRSAPMMQSAECFSTGDERLPQLNIEEWQGFIFVNADSKAPPFSSQISGLEKLITNYDFGSLRLVDTLHYPSPWNWKILVENFMEAYHHIGTHKASLEALYPARDSFVTDNDGEAWAFLRMPGRRDSEAIPTSFDQLNDSERSSLFAACVFPCFLIAASNESAVWYQLMPTSHDQMDLYIHVLARPELVEGLSEDERTKFKATFAAIHEEDIAANKGPWFGLNSRFAAQGRLSPYEKAIWQLNQYWMSKMDGAQ